MLENKQKGWHGCYSRIGKNSAENFNEIIKKDEIFQRLNKRIKVKDFYAPDKPIKKLEYLEDNLKFFHIYQNDLYEFSKKDLIKINKKQNNKDLKIENSNKNISTNNKFKYHNLHINKNIKKKLNGIIFTPRIEYNPKYTLIFSRSLSGPFWNKIKGRKSPMVDVDDRDFFYNEKNNYFNTNEEFKCLVNMNKCTQRGKFIDLKNVRIKNEKAFIKEKNNNKSKNKLNIKLIKYMKNFIKENYIKNSNNYKKLLLKDLSVEQNISKLESYLISIDNFNDKKHNTLRSKMTYSNKSKTYTNFNFKVKENKKDDKNKLSIEKRNDASNQKILKPSLSKQEIKRPNLKKSVTIQYLEKLKKIHSTYSMLSYESPEYTFIRNRFDININTINENDKKTKYKTRKRLFIGIDPFINCNNNKYKNK